METEQTSDTVGRHYPRKFAKPIEKGGKLWILMTINIYIYVYIRLGIVRCPTVVETEQPSDTVGRHYPRKFAKLIEKGGKLWILMTINKSIYIRLGIVRCPTVMETEQTSDTVGSDYPRKFAKPIEKGANYGY